MGPGARIHRPKDPDRRKHRSVQFFLAVVPAQSNEARLSARLPQRLHKFRWVDRDAVLHRSSSTDFRHWFVVEHGEMARRAPPNNFFLHAATTVSCILQFAACSSHGRKIVDLYIYEQFGQLLVTVGQFANPIAEYGLHKMLRSRCFATIIQRPFREQSIVHETRPFLIAFSGMSAHS